MAIYKLIPNANHIGTLKCDACNALFPEKQGDWAVHDEIELTIEQYVLEILRGNKLRYIR